VQITETTADGGRRPGRPTRRPDHSRRGRAVLAGGALLAALGGLTACGSEAEEGIETMQTAPSVARTAACRTEAATVRTAIAAYELVNGEPPAAADDLVGDTLDQRPTYVDLAPSGDLVLTPAGEAAGCTPADLVDPGT